MKLIKADGTVVSLGNENLVVTPVPQERLDALRASIEADGPRIAEMVQKQQMDAAILGPCPVGGEDEYFAARKKMSER